ncbi:MAG: N-acetylneuraminate synthase family protein [Promethearchaeota archaeon]
MKLIKESIKESAFFIIAEIGLNHDGSLGNAIRLIEEAKKAGVNAVKFQLHISDEETLPDAPKPPYFKLEERFDYFNRIAFSNLEWKTLKDYAHNLGLYFLVSPFSHKAVDILEEIEVDAFKIASGETTNLPLLEYIDTKGKPVLLSTGMSNWEEIRNAVNSLKQTILVLFQCSSQYPCTPENVGLNIINEMISKYPNLIIGYSDHTLNNVSSLGALMSGAKVFEKHFTLSKKMYGADAQFSLEPEEMLNYVQGIEFLSTVMKNNVDKNEIKKYKDMKITFEKSIVAIKDLEKGKIIEESDLAFKKPGDGIRADFYKKVIGKTVLKKILKNEKILFNNIE